MTKQVINLGTAPAGAGGDDRRSAWIKARANFTELYNWLANLSQTDDQPTALPATLPVARGGTARATIALFLADLVTAGAYSKTSILGPVSQVGGVPAGAIIEQGSNANGEYIKLANGTLICVGVLNLGSQNFVATGGIAYAGPFAAIPFAANFSGIPKCDITAISSGGLSWAGKGSSFATASNTGAYFVMNPVVTTMNVSVSYTAIGRWY